MSSYFRLVAEFHEAAGVPIRRSPGVDENSLELRLSLNREEFAELEAACAARDLVEIADAIADLIYVLCGMALAFGIPLDSVFAEVHRSNMSKVPGMIVREDGKVLKGLGYQPPDIRGVFDAHS